jgi:metallo-beta-lactamase family protein
VTLKLSFFGAAGNVTGSQYLLEANGSRVLVDCGMYQERDLKDRNWEEPRVPLESIDAMLLTHAHLDHCGLIPRLVNQGFKGPIFCTPATGEIAGVVMRDSGKIQEEDVAFKKRRHEAEGRKGPHPYEPLYTAEDAEAAIQLLSPVLLHEPVSVVEGVQAEFSEAGHILGAASILVTVGGEAGRKILFSGDIGRSGMPILRDPENPPDADYVVIESTYGNRVHDDNGDIPDKLAEAINAAHKAGGNVIIPSFAVERSQDLLYHLRNLLEADRIPHMMVFLDSPMAIRVTDIFKKHPELFDEAMQDLRSKGIRLGEYRGLKLTRSVEESKAINHIRGSAIIIAGSGMCTGGRVKHHLANNIEKPEAVVLFIGYQAVGTLGRSILDGAKEVRILGEKHPVRASVKRIGGFSGHADQGELMKWIGGMKTRPKRVFVTHGEPEAAEALAGLLRTELGAEVTVPAYEDSVVLD